LPAKYRCSAIIIALIFLLVICLSAVQYLYCKDKLERRVLFFPTVSSARLVGEERLIPLKKGEAAVRILLAEIILGPVMPNNVRILPRETRITSLLWRKDSVYVNFSNHILFPGGKINYSYVEILHAVGNSILFNFPRVKHLYIFIDGQIPGIGTGKIEELHFTKEIMQ
jgi:hypothetical protein